jgi:FkbM family methyltransferase
MSIRKLFRSLVPYALRRKLGARSTYCQSSYAQEGEDRLLLPLLGFPKRVETGFYVDVGAHHPERFSNTFLFYEMGWHGINIDAMPGSMNGFMRSRPRDINVEAAVAEEVGSLTFYEFNEPALNGFSKDLAEQRAGQLYDWKIIRERRLTTVPLSQLLEKHLPREQKIDFMSIDVEGLDLEVLRSNDWEKFRPSILLVEDSDEVVGSNGEASEITRFLEARDYRSCCKTLLTTFFVAQEQVEQTPVGLRLRSGQSALQQV